MFFTLYISLLLRLLRTFLKLRHLRSYFSGARAKFFFCFLKKLDTLHENRPPQVDFKTEHGHCKNL